MEKKIKGITYITENSKKKYIKNNFIDKSYQLEKATPFDILNELSNFIELFHEMQYTSLEWLKIIEEIIEERRIYINNELVFTRWHVRDADIRAEGNCYSMILKNIADMINSNIKLLESHPELQDKDKNKKHLEKCKSLDPF